MGEMLNRVKRDAPIIYAATLSASLGASLMDNRGVVFREIGGILFYYLAGLGLVLVIFAFIDWL